MATTKSNAQKISESIDRQIQKQIRGQISKNGGSEPVKVNTGNTGKVISLGYGPLSEQGLSDKIQTGQVDSESVIFDPVKSVKNAKRTTPIVANAGLFEITSATAKRAKATAAEKKYQDYLKSPEYGQSLTERRQKYEQNRKVVGMLGGLVNPGYEPKMEDDPMEVRLRAEAQQARAEADAEEEAAVAQRDMAEIESMTAEERRELERFATGVDVDFFDSLNMAQNGIQIGRAEQQASSLMQKYGEQRLNELANTLRRQQNAQTAEEVDAAARKEVNDSLTGYGVLANAKSVPASVVGGTMGTLGFIRELSRGDERYKTLDPNTMGNMGNVYSGAVRGHTAQNISGDVYDENGNLIRDGGKLRGALSIGYQGIMAAADTIARGYLGGGAWGGAALAATNTFSQTMADASRQGATPGQAAILATGTAAIEALSEKLPLDRLLKQAEGGKQAIGTNVKNALTQAGIEATTEEISLVGSLLWEAAVLREKSGYEQTALQQILQGKSPTEAREIAARQVWDEAINTALVSAVSGGVSSGVAGAMARVRANRAEAAPVQNKNADQIKQEALAEVGALDGQQMQEQTEAPQAPTVAPAAESDNQQLVNQAVAKALGVVQPTAEPLTPQERGIRYKASKVNTAILDLVDRVKKGVAQSKEKVQLGTVSDTNAAQIQRETGIDTRGYYVAIEARQIEHILKDHGENGAANRSMANPEDIARIEYALNNPDRISKSEPTRAYVTNKNGKMKPADTVLYETRLEDGSYYVVQAVPETKKKTLYVLTAFIGKSDYNNEAPRFTAAVDPSATPEAESVVTSREALRSTNINDHSATPEAAAVGTSSNSVPETGAEVNRNLIQTQARQQNREAPFDATGTVGSAKSKFRHEVKESGVYANTYANANNAELRVVGEDARAADPNISRYDVITEEESLEEARLRTGTAQDRYVEHRQLMAKDGWSGADNDTAMRLLTAYRKEGKADRLRELARKQKTMGTQAGQMTQSFAKYSREDATVAVLDAVKVLEKMGISDVPKKFWKKGDNEPSHHANVGDPDDYSDTAASRMSDTQQKNTIFSKRHMDKQDFEAWKTSVTKSMLEIANDIEAVKEDDVEAMRGIVRQLAQFRRTTAWFGTQNRLAKNADRILEKMDFDTAKTIAKAQLAMIPDDFRKRSAGETAKTIRIHNMLSALTTTNRNTVGNVTMGIMDAFSDSTVARAMDVAMSKFTGIRTVGNDLKYGKTYFNAARDAADMAALCVELNIPLASESRYSAGNTRTHTTQGGPLGRFLSAYEKYMKYSLEVTDKFFEGGSTAAVNQSIRDLGAKTGLSEDQISGLAERAGQRRTFKEDRNLSRGAKNIKEGANIMFGAGEVGAGDVLMPFAGVPMDIAQTAVDYSGTGMALGLGEMIEVLKAAKNGDTTIKNKRTGTKMPLEIAQRKAVSDFGRGVTGIGLIALSAAASVVGAIKVHNSKDWEKKGMEQAQNLDGAQANLSVIWRGLTGDDSSSDPMEWRSGEDVVIGMDFLEPFNSAMNIGYLISQEPDFVSMVKNYPKHALVGVMEAMMDMPVMTLLSEIQELVQSIGETDEEGNPSTTDALGQVAGTIATSAVPSFIRQTAQTIDPYYRDTYDSDPLKQAGKRVVASLPFASMTLPKKYDGFGNVQKRYDDTTTGGKVVGALNNLFLPDDVEKIGGNAVTDYLGRLSADTGETSMYPEEQAPYKFMLRGEEIELTGEQRATYQKTYGEKNMELYSGLINYPGFSDLPEDVQIGAFGDAKSIATKVAKAAVSDYRDAPTEPTEYLVKGIVMNGVNDLFTGAFSDLVEDRKLGYDTAGAVIDLDAAYTVYDKLPDAQKRAFRADASGRVKYFLEAMARGMDTQTFVDFYQEYQDIENSETLTTTQKANEWATVLEEGVDAGLITENQKKVMKRDMVFRYSLQAETEKFDEAIESGVKTDVAKMIVDLVMNAQGTGSVSKDTGKKTVRNVDKWKVLAESNLTEAEKDIAIKLYMPDYDRDASSVDRTEVKYEYARQVYGLSPEEYVETKRAYDDNRYKADKIIAIIALGYSEKMAENLYYLYYGNQSKVASIEWYEHNFR